MDASEIPPLGIRNRRLARRILRLWRVMAWLLTSDKCYGIISSANNEPSSKRGNVLEVWEDSRWKMSLKFGSADR